MGLTILLVGALGFTVAIWALPLVVPGLAVLVLRALRMLQPSVGSRAHPGR